MTGDDLMAKLAALSPEDRARPVLVTDMHGDWMECEDIGLPDDAVYFPSDSNPQASNSGMAHGKAITL